MANDVTTGIRLVASGEQEFASNLGKASEALEDYKKAAENAKAETEKFDEQIKDVEMLGQVVSTLLEINAAIIAGVNEVAEKGDAVGKGAQQIGFAAEAYQEWAFVLERNNSSITKASTAIQTLTKISGNASQKQTEAFEALGLSMTEIADMSPEQLFGAVIQGLQGIEDEGTRAVLATTLLGGSYKNLGTLLNSSAEETDALRKKVHDLGLVMSDDTILDAAAYQDSLDDFKATIEGIKTDIFEGLLPGLADTRNGINDLLQQVDWGALGTALNNLYEPGIKLLNDFLIPFAGLNLSAATAMLSGLNAVLEETGKILSGEETLGEGLDNLWNYGEWSSGTPEEILADQKELATQARLTAQAFGDMYGASTGGLAPDIDASLYTNAAQAVSEYGEAVKASAGDAENAAAANQWLDEQLQQLLNTYGTEALGQEGDGFGNAEKQQEIANILAGIVAQYQELANQTPAETAAAAAQMAVETITEAGQTAAEGAATMLETFDQATGQLSSDFKSGTDEMAQAAADSIQGVNDVMNANMAVVSANARVWGVDMMISFANGLSDGWAEYTGPQLQSIAEYIEGLFGHSEPDFGPLANDSTWMPDMMKSFAQGIRDNRYLVIDQLDSLAADMGRHISLGGPGSAGSSYNYGGVNVTFNVPEGANGRQLFEEFSYWLQNGMASEGAVFAQ